MSLFLQKYDFIVLTETDVDALEEESVVIEFKSHLKRLQRQMIALLSKYCLTDALLKQVTTSYII